MLAVVVGVDGDGGGGGDRSFWGGGPHCRDPRWSKVELPEGKWLWRELNCLASCFLRENKRKRWKMAWEGEEEEDEGK